MDFFDAMEGLDIVPQVVPAISVRFPDGTDAILCAHKEWHEKIFVLIESAGPHVQANLRIMSDLVRDGYSMLAYDRLKMAERMKGR